MARRIFALLLVISILSISTAEAKKAQIVAQPKHFVGLGAFIWNEIQLSGQKPEVFASKAKKEGLNFVLIKAFDGDSWGVRINGQFQSNLDKKTIRAFRKQGIRVYAYGTARTKARSNIASQVEHAKSSLHMGVNGIVLDDMFAYGQNPKQIEDLFGGIKKHLRICKRCQGKTLAFSTFPHVTTNNIPWEMTAKYADYFLPQLYWQQVGVLKPEKVFRYFEQNWYYFKQSHPKLDCKIVPVAQTYDENKRLTVSAKDLEDFFTIARLEKYSGAILFRWGTTNEKEWQAIRKGWNPQKPAKAKNIKRRRPQVSAFFILFQVYTSITTGKTIGRLWVFIYRYEPTDSRILFFT